MTDSVSSVGGGQTATTNQLSLAATKKALDVQKQEGENVAKLLETAVVTPQGSSGQQLDVTA
jgi:hypothetical protein